MAKKNRGLANLAGLAALGYLGYKLAGDKGTPAPVESREAAPAAMPTGPDPQSMDGVDLSESKPYRDPQSMDGVDLTPSATKAPSTPDRRGKSEAASMGKNYKPRRDNPGTVDMRGKSEASSMSKNYRPRQSTRAAQDDEQLAYARKNILKPLRDIGSNYGASMAKPRTGDYETPYDRMNRQNREAGINFKKGGAVKKMAKGGIVKTATKSRDGIAQRGKTRGKMY